MSLTMIGAVLTAGALGVTHALEPDHVAGISALTSQYGDSRLSALVGVCFSAGHVALVITWLVLGYVVLAQSSFPAIVDTVGTLVVSVVLGVFGALLARRGYRTAARAHRRDHHHGARVRDPHQDRHVREPHVHLPLIGPAHEHDHDVGAYLKTGVVGALFTLSPPLSMIVFLGSVLPARGPSVAILAVGTYGVGITVTMAALGAGVGGLFDLAQRHERLFGVLSLVTGVGVIALALLLGTSATAALA